MCLHEPEMEYKSNNLTVLQVNNIPGMKDLGKRRTNVNNFAK